MNELTNDERAWLASFLMQQSFTIENLPLAQMVAGIVAKLKASKAE